MAGWAGSKRIGPAGDRGSASNGRVLGGGANTAAPYSGGGLRLCSFRSSRPFQYLKLLSKCCIRLGRSAKAGTRTKRGSGLKSEQVDHFLSKHLDEYEKLL